MANTQRFVYVPIGTNLKFKLSSPTNQLVVAHSQKPSVVSHPVKASSQPDPPMRDGRYLAKEADLPPIAPAELVKTPNYNPFGGLASVEQVTLLYPDGMEVFPLVVPQDDSYSPVGIRLIITRRSLPNCTNHCKETSETRK